MHIGGYGQLSLKQYDYVPPSSAIKLQSARACLYLFIKSSNASVIYVPNYICDSILPALEYLNITIRRYDINEHLLPRILPTLANGEYLLIVNYFGLLSKQINALKVNKSRVIVDNSQAFFSNMVGYAASIYSLRKFFPVPDGGYLLSNIKKPNNLDMYNGEEHLKHLVLRGVGLVNQGYTFFLKAELALNDFKPKLMSSISEALMKTVDVDNVKTSRRNNFLVIHEHLKEFNLFDLPLSEEDVPLCYPLMLDQDVSNLHAKLVNKNIFTPRYWPSVPECSIYRGALFIPVDERIGENEMNFILAELEKNI
jgi:hypothetical protein